MGVRNMTVDGSAGTERGCWEVRGVVQPTGGTVGWPWTLLLPGPAVHILEDLPGGREKVYTPSHSSTEVLLKQCTENHLCHSKEWNAGLLQLLTTMMVTVSICSGLCPVLSLFPDLFIVTYKLGKLLPPGFGRRKWMFPEVK